MKKRIKVKRIENEIKNFSKDKAKINALKQKQTKELVCLVLILILMISIFSRNIVISPCIKLIFDFIIYTFISILVLRELYAEFIDKYPMGTAQHKSKFKLLLLISFLSYIAILILLFYTRIKNIFF